MSPHERFGSRHRGIQDTGVNLTNILKEPTDASLITKIKTKGWHISYSFPDPELLACKVGTAKRCSESLKLVKAMLGGGL